jgi:hypothetical protein
MIWVLLGLLWLALAGAGALLLGRIVARAEREEIRAEAWDHGFTHGVGLAHQTVATYPKPWITMGEERGWELAREQLRLALSELGEDDAA